MSEIQKEKIMPYIPKPRAYKETYTPLGDQYMIKAKLSIGKNGEQIAEPGDKVDFQAYIQASKDSTDIATIVARAKAGDESVLNVTPNGFYGDVDMIPNSVNDVEKIRKLSDTAKENFDKLPAEIKELFGSSAEFFNAVLNNKADEIVSKYLASKEQASEKKESEVSE